jgi:predicted ester cyclase
MKIKKTEFSKLLSPHTRGWIDSKGWREILLIIRNVIGEELIKDNIVHLPFGEFKKFPNKQKTIQTAVCGNKDVPIRHEFQVRCSCSNQFKGIVNAERE